MTCSVKFVRLNEIYMCTEFYMNTCKHVWAIHQVFKLCSRGRRRAPVPRPGPSLCGVRTPTDSNVCANFQEFLSMLRPPKVPGWLNKKIKKKKKKIIILWKSIGPCALLAWALIILRKTRGPCALLAWALIILWKSIGPCALLAWALKRLNPIFLTRNTTSCTLCHFVQNKRFSDSDLQATVLTGNTIGVKGFSAQHKSSNFLKKVSKDDLKVNFPWSQNSFHRSAVTSALWRRSAEMPVILGVDIRWF